MTDAAQLMFGVTAAFYLAVVVLLWAFWKRESRHHDPPRPSMWVLMMVSPALAILLSSIAAIVVLPRSHGIGMTLGVWPIGAFLVAALWTNARKRRLGR